MSDDNPHVIDEQYKAMEEMKCYRAKAQLSDLMTGLAELAGGLQILEIQKGGDSVQMDNAISVLYKLSHQLTLACRDVWEKHLHMVYELDRLSELERHHQLKEDQERTAQGLAMVHKAMHGEV